jgi:SAM-dependent methyltransferase
MPNKRTYENQSPADLYGDSHYVEERAKEAIAEFVLDSLQDEGKKTNAVESILRLFGVEKKLTILDAGIGSGELLPLPLIDHLSEEGISFEITGIDTSEQMVSRLHRNLKSREFEKRNLSEDGLVEWVNNKNCIRVFKHDLDSPLPKEIAERYFDLVLAVSTLHHLRNWRIALSSLLDTLKPGGHFVIYEATNGFRLRDGTFSKDGKRDQFEHIRDEVLNFWKDFYQERNNYHLWNPEICASDHSAVKRILKKHGPMTLAPPEQESRCFEWKESMTQEKLSQLISGKSYSNFYRGLSKKERTRLEEFSGEKSKTLPKEWEEKNGYEVTICRKVKEKCNNESSDFDYAMSESPIFSKIIEDKNVGVSELFAFAMLLIQHDFFTPRTLHFTLNSWDLIEENWKSEDKPEIFNLAHEGFDEYLPSFLLYRQLVRSQDISATKLIFRKFARKVPLVIHRNQEQTGWRIEPTVNREEKLRRLDVYLSDDLIDTSERQCLISSQRERANKIASGESNWRSVGERISHLKVGWTESPVYGSLDEFWSSDSVDEGIKAFKSAFENESADAPWLLPRSENGRGDPLEALVKVLLRHLCMTEWDTITYVSAESRTPQEEGENGKDSGEAVGFGGIILVEKNEELRDSESYLENRLPALETAVNLKYRDLGVLEHAKSERHRVKRHALQSFLSEVYARNFAHNIGSHVATNATNAKVKKRIKELYPNG